VPPARKRGPIVPQKAREAYEYILSTPGATLQTAAQHVGWTTRKLRFYLTQPHVLRWMLQEKQARLEAASARFCRYATTATTRWRRCTPPRRSRRCSLDTVSERTGITRGPPQRQPGLQIVIVQNDGSRQVAYQPDPQMPMLDVTPVPAPEAVPAIPSDADAE
jgi:hypothetical protein